MALVQAHFKTNKHKMGLRDNHCNLLLPLKQKSVQISEKFSHQNLQWRECELEDFKIMSIEFQVNFAELKYNEHTAT